MKQQEAGAGHREPDRVILPRCLPSPADARRELERIGVDPAGITRMLPKLRHQALLLPGIRSAAANIIKQEMLSLGGDAAVARGTVACSIPSTDVLLIGTHKQIQSLCRKLTGQPFGLGALAAEIAAVLQRLESPVPFWQTSQRRLTLDRPLVMGVVNVTPDSFSDGGCYLAAEAAVAHARALLEQGADLLDIGGESTRPGAPPTPADEELRRILPVIEALAGTTDVPLSVDTWKASVADAALNAGAEIVNDISGLSFDPHLADVVERHRAGLVLMHTRGTPQEMQRHTCYDDLPGEVAACLQAAALKALAAGIGRECLVLDPGIGFGKDTAGNLELLRRLPELLALGYPLLVGTSRKSFIGSVLKRQRPSDRLFGTAATVALAVANGARILRVHDVEAMKDVALMAHAVVHQPS